jgi:hypothetical protein
MSRKGLHCLEVLVAKKCCGGPCTNASKEIAAWPRLCECWNTTTVSRIAGYYIAGHGVGESREERQSTISTVFEDLPESKVRLVNGLGGLDEILEAVLIGFDVLESRLAFKFEMHTLCTQRRRVGIQEDDLPQNPWCRIFSAQLLFAGCTPAYTRLHSRERTEHGTCCSC